MKNPRALLTFFRCTSKWVAACSLVLGLFFSNFSFAQRFSSEQAFDRMEETLQPKIEEGTLAPKGVGPVLLVGATSAFEETRAWFPTAALESLIRLFGPGNVRACEACMNPVVRAIGRRLEYNTILSLSDVARLDEETRGKSAPARTAVWVEETPSGISVRMVSIHNGQVLFAGNFDDRLQERTRTSQNYNFSLDLGRRLRGESLTHVMVDIGLVPGQHVSLDVLEQFGPHNLNLAGLTLSLFDPVVGIGLSYYRVFPSLWNLTLGVKGIASTLTAVVTALSQGEPVENPIDPLLTGVLVARFPIPSTNFAVLGTVSTNAKFTIGVTVMNVSFLPFLP